jgi:tRNA U55 pseudouridine synthase TruB
MFVEIVAKAEDKKPKNVKVGHSALSTPLLTGLLVLLVGKEYTSKAQKYSKLNKTYEITMKLGAESSTGDPEGVLGGSSKSTTNYKRTDSKK